MATPDARALNKGRQWRLWGRRFSRVFFRDTGDSYQAAKHDAGPSRGQRLESGGHARVKPRLFYTHLYKVTGAIRLMGSRSLYSYGVQ